MIAWDAVGDVSAPVTVRDWILVAGTRNLAKVVELTRLVAALPGWRVVAPPADAIVTDDEVGATVAAVAGAKAAAWSRAVGTAALVVATDGGLLLPALGAAWEPVRTRRFAGSGATEAERARALLRLAAGLQGAERQIGWREALAVAREGSVLATFVGESPPGMLAEDVDPTLLAARVGFWVPALWRCPEFGGKRLGALTPAEQAARPDHWDDLGAQLRSWLKGMSGEGAPRAGRRARVGPGAIRRGRDYRCRPRACAP